MTEAKACVSHHISAIHDQHPTWEQKKIIALAYKKCKVKKDDMEDFCPYHVLAQIDFQQAFESELIAQDFSEVPLSVRIGKAVDFVLPKLEAKYDLPRIELLKVAYNLVKQSIGNADFETMEEDSFLFVVQISNENLEQFEDDLQNYAYLLDFTDDKKTKEKFFAPDTGVSSSNIAMIGYDLGKLRVHFNNASGYEYDVEPFWYQKFMQAPSKGAFLWKYLRGKAPGRVIDNPNKVTPGGVGGSIVPYFKITGAQMSQESMKKSVLSFIKAAKKGGAEINGVEISESKAYFKRFETFVKKGAGHLENKKQTQAFQKGATASRATPQPAPTQPTSTGTGTSTRTQQPTPTRSKPRSFTRISFPRPKGKKSTKKREKTDEEIEEAEDRKSKSEERKRLIKKKKALVRILTQAAKNENASLIKSVKRQMAAIDKKLKSLRRDDFIYTDDFMTDMKYWRGPITRAGPFEYTEGIKIKEMANLIDVSQKTVHMPVFDSHGEHSIIGFGTNLTQDPDVFMKTHPKYDEVKDKNYIFSEGYAFDDIESIADIEITETTELPVSIRFQDINEGTSNPIQDLSDIVHLAISVNQTETDRCSSADGAPCWVSFSDQQDFLNEGENPMPKKKEKETDATSEDMEEEDKGGKETDAPEDEKKREKEERKKNEEKESKDKKDDFIPKAELDKRMDQLTSDFQKKFDDLTEDFQKKLIDQEELGKLQQDFTGNELYKLNPAFLKTAKIDDFRRFKAALVPYQEKVNGANQLFGQSKDDFSNDLEEIKKRNKERYL